MSEVPRGPKGHRRYRMDYIPDRDLFKAVTFARSMISDGTSPGRAFRVAANYYGVGRDDVAHYTAQYAGSMGGKARVKSSRRPVGRKKTEVDNCSTCFYGRTDSIGLYCFKDDDYGRSLTDAELISGCKHWKDRVVRREH